MAERTRGKNAIERRVDRIREAWNAFALNQDARVLRWLVTPDEARMLEVFLAVEQEEVGELPDFFLRFEEPSFQDPYRYGFDVVAAFQERYAQTREELAQLELQRDWTAPPARPGESNVAALLACATSFRQYHQSGMEHLVLVLTPSAVSDAAVWGRWLLALVRTGLPPDVRIMVWDEIGAPLLDDLAAAEPQQVVTEKADLDLPRAYLDAAREFGGTAQARGFRAHFVGMANAAAKQDLHAVGQSAKAAVAIAREHGWAAQEVAAFAALGGAFLGAGKATDALKSYRLAGQAAAKAVEGGDPAGPKLVLHTKLAEGAALVAAGEWREAATVYQAAVPLAEKTEDRLLAVEGWRMAAYCQEAAGERERAWELGFRALAAGEALPQEQRAQSTLPYATQALLRLTRGHEAGEREVRRRAEALLGPEWERALAAAGAGSAGGPAA